MLSFNSQNNTFFPHYPEFFIYNSSDIIVAMKYLHAGAVKLGIELNPKQHEQFHAYYQELIDWNRQINLTSITDYKEVQIKHFLDSLTVILAIKQPITIKNISLIDVGSGAGFPGLPLKIAFPDINLLLLEATTKKTGFLNHLIRKLKLDDVEVLSGRAEEVAHKAQYRQHFYIVLSRAVASLPTLAELTLPFCVIKGRTIIQKKGDIEDELNQAARAIKILGGGQLKLKKIELPEFTDNRYLIIIDKVSTTPTKYPRRPGIPAKRPIV